MKRLALSLTLGLLLTLAVTTLASQAVPGASPQSVNTGQHFFPPFGNPRDRFGFDSNALSGYDVAQLGAGWYSNWGARLNPAHPDHLVYAQLIRFHAGADPNDPAQVSVNPNKDTIAQIAAAHPGSLWLMSNEPDSVYQGDPILPEVYAVVYRDFYAYIKGLDPTALIANGGIVQPTPCRLEYLDIVWDTYSQTYSETMPVDVWNIHAFVLREIYDSWGASTPPGVDRSCAMDYSVNDAEDLDIFWANIKAMRSWMKEKGQQDKPLIISEYGILWPQWFAPQFTPQRVSHFMTQTFELFLYDTDPDIGYPADDHRLVQAWAWYSLSDDVNYNGHLFHSDSKTISPMGEAYAAYTANLSDTPSVDLSARLVAAQPRFAQAPSEISITTPVTFTISLTGHIGNLGKLSTADALARMEIAPIAGGTALFDHEASYAVPARFDGLVGLPPITATLTAPGAYHLRLSLDPEDQIEEPREWNNVATTTLELRPDLAGLDVKHEISAPLSKTLTLTATVGNQGTWPSPVVTTMVRLEPLLGGAPVAMRMLLAPSLSVDAEISLTTDLSWTVQSHNIYSLVLELDAGDHLFEQDEENNRLEAVVPFPVSASLSPSETTTLTNASGAVQLVFPGGVVTAPTEILYTPLWPIEPVPAALNASTVAFSLTATRGGQPVAWPPDRTFTVTWHYTDSQVMGLDEGLLRLFALDAPDRWREAGCGAYQRNPNQDRLTTPVCQMGRFVFGVRYDVFLPLVRRDGGTQHLEAAPTLPPPESNRPRSPLRLGPRP